MLIKNFSARYNGNYKDIIFSSEINTLNISVITGENGSSKSSILRDITIAALGANEQIKTKSPDITKTHYISNEIQAEFIYQNSINIVSASGTPFDRFPQKLINGKSTKYNSPNYIYIGQRIGTNLLSKKPVVELIIEQLLLKNKELWHNLTIINIFKKVGLLPQIHIEIRKKIVRNFSSSSNRGLLESIERIANKKEKLDNTKDPILRRHSMVSLEKLLIDYDYDDFTDLDYFVSTPPTKTKISIDFDGASLTGSNLEYLALGLASGVLEVSNCNIIGYQNSSSYSIYELSSGEYLWLTSMLALYLTACEKSIILIDEPENSLHPAWQSSFINTLIEICDYKKVSQLIIGTHSPIIVSSLPENTEVISLSNGEDKRSFYAKSVDDILLENFKMPSTRNFYFYSDLQNAINMYANNHQHSKKYKKLITNLCQYRKNLKDSDPAAEILDFLSSELPQDTAS